MNEFEQNVLLEEAKLLMEEAARAFFDGRIDRATHMALVAYAMQDANPTREGLDALMSRLNYMRDALEHYFHNTAEKDDA